MSNASALKSTLLEICQAIGSSLELNEVLDTILKLTVREVNASSGSILLYDSGSDELKMLASLGLPSEVMERGYIPRRGSIAEKVIATNEAMILSDKVDETKGVRSMDGVQKIRSSMCVPLRAKGAVIGTLNLNRYDAAFGPFQNEDRDDVITLASQAAISIENARLLNLYLEQERMAAIGQTVAGISHCVKNMLTGLRGGLGLVELAQQAENWDANEKGLGLLRRSVERVSLLVLDMLDFSREKEPLRRNANLNKIISEVLEITSYKADKKEIEQSIEIDDSCESINVDPDQLFRCLLNLVENSVDAIDKGGQVVVRGVSIAEEETAQYFGSEIDVKKLGHVVRISVEDNGQGIDSENLESIFQPFFSTKESKGTGLGLAVTKKIIEEHGGQVTVDSEVGKGTMFHMIIPEYNCFKSVQ